MTSLEASFGRFGPLRRYENHTTLNDEVRQFFRDKIYGRIPEDSPEPYVDLAEEGLVIDSRTREEKAYRRQFRIALSREGETIEVGVLMYTPLTPGPHPMLLAPNIYGNHSLTDDPKVFRRDVYAIAPVRFPIPFREEHRGAKQDRFNMDEIVRAGYAAVTFWHEDIVPDTPVGPDVGAYKLFPDLMGHRNAPRALSMWGFGIREIGEIMRSTAFIAPDRIAAMAFSRDAKALNLLFAHNHPFKAGISVASGKGGAAAFKSFDGEPSLFVAGMYPQWWTPSLTETILNSPRMPFGPKYLLALSNAPLMVSVAKNDWWSAVGQQERTVNSANKIRIKRGLPPTLEFITHEKGGHSVSPDWNPYLDFLNRHV